MQHPTPRLTAQDFDQELLILFDAYVHGNIDRRGFLDKAQKFAVGGLTAVGILAALSPNFAMGQVIPKDDGRIKTEMLEFNTAGYGKMKGYLCRPANAAATAKLPGILVVHENRGLNPHIEDIARRLAVDGYMAFAPDALTPLGGYPGDEDRARTLFGQLDQKKTLEDFVAAANLLKARADSTGKIGVVGFCYGGGMAHTLATRMPDLAAAVPLLRQPPSQRRCRQSQGAAIDPLRRCRRAHQRGLARLRSRAQNGGRQIHRAPVRRHPTRLQQRHHPAFRRRRRPPRVGAHDGVFQADPGLMGCAWKLAALGSSIVNMGVNKIQLQD